jgi:hypothetical protein
LFHGYLHELLELLPAISEIWDDATAISKKAAKRVTKEAKNPVYGWVAVGLAVAVTAVVAYSILKPEEDELWLDVREESTEG